MATDPQRLTQAIYFPSNDTVVLLPNGKHALPKLEQLQVNVSLLTDPMGRPINNGKNFNATVTNTGLVISTRSAPSPGAVNALFERGLIPSIKIHREYPESGF